MRWSAQQITLPLLIGVSLTGVCIGLYYFLYKKDEENEHETLTLKDNINHIITMRMLRQHVPVVIGRGGTTIKDIEQKTSTKIRFNDDDVTVPERICIIKGTFECATLAEALIKNIIENQPIIEIYETFIPQRVCTELLANRGEVINTIQATTHAKLILEKGYFDNGNKKRRVIIKGSVKEIASALEKIEQMVFESNKTREKLEASQTLRSPRGKVSSRNTPINKVEPQLHLEGSSDLHESVMEIYVSAIDNPSRFWVQVNSTSILALDELVENMTDYYNNKENHELHALKNITIGQIVAAKFSVDNLWYRAEVLSCVDNEKYEVFFVDYGDNDVLLPTDILELRTDFLSLRLQAIECSLANVKPKDDEWSKEVCERFSDLCWCAQWKVLTAKVRGYKERVIGQGKCRREGSPIPCVDLFDKNNDTEINIGKQLVTENLAVSDEGAWSTTGSTLSLSKPSNDVPSTPPPTPSIIPDEQKNATEFDIATPQKRSTQIIDEIDLTTPNKTTNNVIEEIDLVTPKNDRSRQFLENEIKMNIHENGSGDYGQNKNRSSSPTMWKRSSNIITDGAESDDEDSDKSKIG